MNEYYDPHPEEHFNKFPEDEDEFYDELARLHENDEPIDYPEDWWFIEVSSYADCG